MTMSNSKSSLVKARKRGFSLVELLVVIGIVGMLVALLLPTLQKARLKAQQQVCGANLRTLHQMMVIYCNDNKGWMFPVGAPPAGSTRLTTIGTNVMPHLRWPVILFSIPYDVNNLAYSPAPGTPPDPAAYNSSESAAKTEATIRAHMAFYDVEPFTPKVLLCPSDYEPFEKHSYVVNQQLVQQDNPVRFSGGDRAGRSSAEIIVAGEKRSIVRDYHMERGDVKPAPDPITGLQYDTDFERVIEPYRHGISYGSNYVFLDGHVDTRMPKPATAGLDPWTIALLPPTTP